MCTNAYAGDLWPGLRHTVIAPNSYQIATEPLSDNIRKSILPFGQVSSDARKLLLYFRLDDRGRFLLGGRGPFREPRDDGDWQHLPEELPIVVTPILNGEADVVIGSRYLEKTSDVPLQRIPGLPLDSRSSGNARPY